MDILVQNSSGVRRRLSFPSFPLEKGDTIKIIVDSAILESDLGLFVPYK